MTERVGTDSLYTDGVPNACHTARVVVGGVEVPTVDSSQHDEPAIRTEIRTDGPASVTRISDVYVPAFWNGENVFDSLPLHSDEKVTVPVAIQTRTPDGNACQLDAWTTIHYGWLRKIGSGGDGRLLRFKVADYANIINNTPATGTWTQTSYQSMLEWYVYELQQKDGFPPISLAGDVSGELVPWHRAPSAMGSDQMKKKSFSATEGDSIATVFNWIAERNGGEETPTDWWVEPTGDGELSLLFTGMSNVSQSWTARSSGGDMYVRDNRALYSIDPINTVTVIGQTDPSANMYAIAKASHTKLLENAGGQVNEKVIRDKYTDLESVKSAAVTRLTEQIQSGGEGEIETDGNPRLFLTDTITSKPICGKYVSADVPDITYEVTGVTHKAPASGRYNTTASVSMYADDDNIEVIDGFGTKEGDIQIADVGELSSDSTVVIEGDDADDENVITP